MSFQESFSRFRKDIKQRIKGGKHKPGTKGAVSVGERIDPLESGSQSAGGSFHDREDGVDSVGEPVHSMHQPTQRGGPAPVSTGAGEIKREGRETNVDHKVSETRVSDRPSVGEPSEGSGHHGGIEQVHSSPSPTPTPRIAEPDGMWILLSRCCL